MISAGLAVRRAITLALKADVGVAAIVGARVYSPVPPADPAWPFIRYESPVLTAFRSAGSDRGKSVPLTIHGFSKSGSDDVAAHELAYAIETALHARTLQIDLEGSGFGTEIVYQQSQVIPDPAEPSAWHAVVRFNAKVIA